jgi:hypothetical protein
MEEKDTRYESVLLRRSKFKNFGQDTLLTRRKIYKTFVRKVPRVM